MDTWILRMVHQRAQRRVAAWGVAIALVALFTYGQSRYLKNFFGGPYALSAADLAAIGDADTAPRPFARVTGTKAIDTGIQQITVEKRNGVEVGQHVSANYFVLLMDDDRLLVVKGTTSSGLHTSVEGEIKRIPTDLNVQLFEDPETKAEWQRFYTFYLDEEESFREPGYVGLVFLAVFVVLAAWQGGRALKQLRDPSAHPAVQRVYKWSDPMGTAVAAERACAAPNFKGKNGWLVADPFLIRRTFFSFDILRLSDLLWAFKKVTQHRVNFIPAGKTHAAQLHCYGGGAEIQADEATVDSILRFAGQRTPWAVFGYDKEVEALFKNDAAGFCRAVEERKRAQSAAAATA